MSKITGSNINDNSFFIIKQKEEVKFTAENGQQGIHTRYPAGYDFGEGVKGSILYEGGGVTEPSKENPLSTCLRMTLYRNKFRKSFVNKVDKEINGKKVQVDEKVLAGSPYTLSISPVGKDDKEFEAFDKGTSTLRVGLVKAFIKSSIYEDEGYDTIIPLPNEEKTPENIDAAARAPTVVNVAKEICAHPLVPKSTTKRDKSKAKTANFDVFDGTSFAVPKGQDKDGNPILSELDKEKLVNAEGNGRDYVVDLYGYPLIKFHKVHLGNNKFSIKCYTKSIIILAVRKREMQSFQNDTALKYMGKVDSGIDDALAKLDLQFTNKTPKLENKPSEETISTPQITDNVVEKTTEVKPTTPTTEGTMISVVKKDALPKGMPKVDLGGMEEFQ